MHDPIRISTPGGSFAAHVAWPHVLPAPAVVLVHEVFGVNADMRQSCDELAQQGYIALCPDLFWRVEPGLELTDATEAERAKATALYASFNLDSGVTDLAATMEAARGLRECTGKVGIAGYCLGGLLAYLAAARVEADVAAAYPGNSDQHLQEARGIASPFLVHLAEEDEYIPKEARERITAALRQGREVQVYTYAGCGHAFARHRGLRYDAAAARLANGRTRAFLDAHLKGERLPPRRFP
jgi:carboxymethylenebutenolidase